MLGPTPDDALAASIDHVQLGMPAGDAAVTAARAFYGGALGLREVRKPAELAGRGGVWFIGRAVAIHLGVEPDHRAPTRAHPAFVVDDLGQARERLTAAGVAIQDDDSGLPIARCYVRDPFGNRIELVDATDAGFSAR
jgi:catechol 2,3-dioxygenase-like lactoylglutathione lyase family enzyme